MPNEKKIKINQTANLISKTGFKLKIDFLFCLAFDRKKSYAFRGNGHPFWLDEPYKQGLRLIREEQVF